MKRLILFISAVITSQLVYGQTEKPDLVTDRPDQTEASTLVPIGALQVETGFVYEHDEFEGLELKSYTYNTSLIKYGVNENLELRLITEYLGEWAKLNDVSPTEIQGFSPIALGVKLRISEEKNFWPQTSMIAHMNFRTGGKDFKPTYTATDFRFTFAHTLSDKWALSYNLGAQWDGETAEATYLYTLSLACVVTDKMGAFIEGYSFFPERGAADNRIDGGITYKFTPMIQYDISAGIGVSEVSPDYFISTGLSFRLFK